MTQKNGSRLTCRRQALTTAFLSLGSNLGDRREMLAKAHSAIGKTAGIMIQRASRSLDNPPLLYENQSNFLNQILEIQTSLSPPCLLRELKQIERTLGRITRFRYGPREIDLDILSYENLRWEAPDLILPHPALMSRPYLRTLLAELQTSPEKLSMTPH